VYGHGEKRSQLHSRLGRQLNNVDVARDERKEEEVLQDGERERGT
jgi:hypothetical protein